MIIESVNPVDMRRYAKGDKVEVLNTSYEYSWHPARIVEVNGDVCTVLYDQHVNGVVMEVMLMKDIRPRPPVVEFSDWSRGDLVHVFDNFVWKLATVLQVLEKNRFLVRVVGSMKDLDVGAAWIRVRHYWQDNQWIVVGKGPSISDAKQPVICHQSSTSFRNACGSAGQRPQARTCKRNAPSTLDQTEEQGKLFKKGRAIERSSPCTRNQTEACTGTGMRSRLTEEFRGPSLPPTNATPKETHKKDNNSYLSSVGSCSVNNNSSSHLHPTKCAGHCFDEEVSDAESCTGPAPKPGSKSRIFIIQKGQKTAAVKRPVRRNKLVLRIPVQNSYSCRDSRHGTSSSSDTR